MVALLAGAACYAPAVRDCAITCASGDACAAGQICGADGLCASPAVAGTCAARLRDAGGADAPMRAPDAMLDAATSLCELGCTGGTCDGGVCVIDCSAAGACPTDVHCPVNLPCRVLCGDHACAHHVECMTSTSCEVVCSGDNSCGDTIDCGLGRCTVTCSGDGSCRHHIHCHDACACDVACTGASSCAEPATCPGAGTTCALGDGCSSQLAGCDHCP